MNVGPLHISRRSLTIAAVLVVMLSLALGAHAALNKRALDAAKAQRYESVVKFLVEKGAKSNSPGKQGEVASRPGGKSRSADGVEDGADGRPNQ